VVSPCPHPICPNDGSFAAFGTGDGRLFCSENRGRLWRELSEGLPAVQHVLVVPD
jgi:hypothetical protein